MFGAKSIIAGVLSFATILGICPVVNAQAAPEETATAIIAVAEGLENAYEASVISRMNGRSGAATASGSKGIVFEIELMDKENLKNLFNRGTKVKLSESSIDTEADLVTLKNGEIVKKFQCKDGTSTAQINDVAKRVKSGQYADSELVGTTEFAEAYNVKAGEEGLEKAIDSGISTKKTSAVAEKALGTINPATLKANVIKAGKSGAVVGTVLSATESIINHDSFSEAVGNVITTDAVTTVSAVMCPLSEAAMISALTALGISSAAAATSGTVAGILVPMATSYLLFLLVDEVNLKETITSAVEWMGNKLTVVYDNIKEEVAEAKETIANSKAIDRLNREKKRAGKVIKSAGSATAQFFTKTWNSAKTFCSETIKNLSEKDNEECSIPA